MAYNSFGNDHSNEFGTQEIADNKILCILAYIPILFWLPLASNSSSPYCRFHANQGLLLLLTCVILSIILSVVTAVIGWIPVVGWIITGLLGTVFSVVDFGLMLIGMITTGKNQSKELPIIGGLFTIIK